MTVLSEIELQRWRIKYLLKAISKIENNYPDDNLIRDYDSFLKHGEYLNNYQYNPKVFDALVKVTLELWTSDQRVNRLNLIQSIKRYGAKRKIKNKISNDTKKNLFTLFIQIVIRDKLKLAKGSQKLIKKIMNSIIIGIQFEDELVNELLEHGFKSEIALNRILRYPVKNKLISNWINTNFKNPILSCRRAEAVGWIIDINPKFKIDAEILIYDFFIINDTDMQKILSYETNLRTTNFLKNELGEIGQILLADDENLSGLGIEFTRRFYEVPKKNIGQYSVIDFEKLEEQFYDELNNYLSITMIWGIYYSRISKSLKENMIKFYYSEKIYSNFTWVSVKLKSAKLLNILLKIKLNSKDD